MDNRANWEKSGFLVENECICHAKNVGSLSENGVPSLVEVREGRVGRWHNSGAKNNFAEDGCLGQSLVVA